MLENLDFFIHAPTMAETASANIFTYFVQSNFAGKIIVLSLLLFSLLGWTVMIGKYMELSRLRSLNQGFEQRLVGATSMLGVDLRGRAAEFGPYAVLVDAGIKAYARYEGTGARARERHAIQMGHVENALQRSVAQQTIGYESKMVLLGSIVTAAPFMGLLGTVWGVMDAFGGIGLNSAATLQNLAPGVSGALLTTVAGLLVAIPSVLGYNFLLTQTKIMITELENFASSLADRVELEMATLNDPEANEAGIWVTDENE